MMCTKLNYIFPLSFLLMVSCSSPEEIQIDGKWIKGDKQKQIEIIERQFRGFDMAMVETGYRYQELYWAGYDKNWEYADYQFKKLKKSINNGLERRPKRAHSAQYFLNTILPEFKQVILEKDSTKFMHAFNTLTVNCNACHSMEHVPFFTVKPPESRQSPIKK